MMHFLQLLTALVGGIVIGSLGTLFLFALVRGAANDDSRVVGRVGIDRDPSPSEVDLRSI